MASRPLEIKPYSVRKASQLIDDSSLDAGSVADALDELAGDAAAGVQGPDPAASTTNALAVWVDTTGREIRDSSIIAHPVTTIDSIDKDKLELGAWFETFETAADGTNVIFDLDKANVWTVVLGGNRTLKLQRDSTCQMVTLMIRQDATGGRKVTWFDDIEWDQGLPPVLDPAASGWDLIVLRSFEDDSYDNPIWREVSRSTSAPRKQIWGATDAGTVTFDLRHSRKQKVVLGGNRTLALNADSIQDGLPFFVKLTQDGTGSRTVTWWTGIKWAGNTVPTLSTGVNLSDWFGFICTDPVTPKFDGFILGQGHPA